MKEPNREQYTQLCLSLIEFKETIKQTWAKQDIDALSDTIDLIRFYRQFTKE